jgi:hypothetical protein
MRAIYFEDAGAVYVGFGRAIPQRLSTVRAKQNNSNTDIYAKGKTRSDVAEKTKMKRYDLYSCEIC